MCVRVCSLEHTRRLRPCLGLYKVCRLCVYMCVYMRVTYVCVYMCVTHVCVYVCVLQIAPCLCVRVWVGEGCVCVCVCVCVS